MSRFAPLSDRSRSRHCKAVSQNLSIEEIARAPAVAGVNALRVVDLLVYLNVELVIRCM